MKKKFFVIVLLFCGCGTVEKSTQNIREEVRVIQKQTDVIDVNADEIISRAPQVAPLAKAIKKASKAIDEQAEKVIKNVVTIEKNEGRDWFRLIFLLAIGLGGVLIGYMSFKVGKIKTTVFGIGMCLSAISLNFWWDFIGQTFVPILGGIFAIVLCVMYVHYHDERRKAQDDLQIAQGEAKV